MTDSKELVTLDSSMDASICSRGSQPSLYPGQLRQRIADWQTYGFSSPGSCEFGSIQFFKGAQKHKKNSKFLIVDSRESPDAVLRVLLEKWRLGLPKLLIRLVGAKRQAGVEHDKMVTMMGKTFAKELIAAIHHTDSWLLTNGLHHGITENVGKALVDATEIAIADRHELVTIGMGPASVMSQMEYLEHSVGGPVEYQMERPDSDRGTTKTCLLDPSHTHFIIEEDRRQDDGGSASLGEAVIDKIAQSKIEQSNATVPVVYVLFGGDGDSLLAVHSAVVARNIPVIIVAGSGGLADRLAGVDQASSNSASSNDQDQAKIGEIMSPSYAHLVTVYREDQKMDAALLLSFMNANRGARGQNELLLAVIWNRIDLARKELTTNKNWIDQFQEVQLAESFQYALIHDHHKFVEFFLERDCIDLKTFLTRERLVDLYDQVGPQTLLWKLLADERKASMERSKDQRTKPDLKDVGNILKSLVGLNSFIPEYLRADGEDTFSKPCQQLFIWAVLQHRRKTAWVFWKHCGTSIGGALLASKLLKSMAQLVNEPGTSDEMLQHGRVFQDRAIQVLNCCYAENRYATCLLLTQVLPDWGGATCLELAFAAKNKLFIGQAAVQNLLQKLWMGRLSADTDLILLWICTLIPFVAPILVKFTSSDKLAKPMKVVRPARNEVPRSPNSSFLHDETDGNYKALPKGLFPKLTQELPTEPSRIPWLTNFLLFTRAPVISFSYHLISHLLFLFLFSYILLKDFTATQSALEIFLMVWVVTLFFEELREFVQDDYDTLTDRLEAWLWGYWNLVDLVALVMFSVGMAMRYSQDLLVGARIVLAMNLLVFYLRLLQFFAANKYLGPKLIMIVKMMVDIVTFLCILFVFLVAYGVAFQSILYPNEQDSLTIVRGVLYQPYFQMYGELFLKDLHNDECDRMTSDQMTTPASIPIVCPQNSWFGTIVLAFYLFISNIMLLNLLIAMFNYTFSTVQDNTDTYWKFQRFQLVKEYHKRPFLAPPFIVFAHVCLVGKAVWRCIFSRNKLQDDSSVMRKDIYIKDQQLYSELSLWESVKGKDYLAATEKQQNKDVLRRIKQTNERLEELSTNSEAMDPMKRLDLMQTHFDRRLTAIETQINGLEELLRKVCGTHLSAVPAGATAGE